jgi:hypothetical protein
LKTTIPSGGAVTVSEKGRPCAGNRQEHVFAVSPRAQFNLLKSVAMIVFSNHEAQARTFPGENPRLALVTR